MEIRRLTTGQARGKRRTKGPLRYLPGGWSEATVPVNAYAVNHPEGVCLFDTGQTLRGSRYRGHPFLWLTKFELEPEEEIAAQIDPQSVRWVVLSHLHVDHVAGLPAFTHAQVLVTRVEWDRATGWRGRLRGYVPQHWPKGVEPRLVDPPHDVAGDGRLVIVPLPGHTPGHAGLLVDDETLLAGDATDAGGFTGRVLRAHD